MKQVTPEGWRTPQPADSGAHRNREASWTAVALYRFLADRRDAHTAKRTPVLPGPTAISEFQKTGRHEKLPSSGICSRFWQQVTEADVVALVGKTVRTKQRSAGVNNK